MNQHKFLYIFIFCISLAKNINSNINEINPNNPDYLKNSIAKITEEDCNLDLEKMFKNTNPFITITTTGYLSISTLNKVIVYPFSENALTVNAYYKNKVLLLKDQNSLILWNYKFENKTNEEIKILTFINRGTLLARNEESERIYPFEIEQMTKKLNLNFNNGNFELTDNNNQRIWTYSVNNQPNMNDSSFLEDEELIKL